MPASSPFPAGILRRPALLLLGALLLQLAFVASYVGAFHQPTPHAVPIGVVAPAGASPVAARQLAVTLTALPGAPLDARVVATRAEATALLRDRTLAAYLALRDTPTEHLYVAGAEGSTEAQAIHTVLRSYLAQTGRRLLTTDAVPPQRGDALGLTAFYLAVGWTVGGYLGAAVIGISAGAKPLTRLRAAVRLAGLGIYACLAGIGGALLVGPAIGALTGHFVAVSAFGALLVFAAAMTTAALQAWLGLLGIAAAIAIFVVVGNPSAGGAFPGPILPPFWRHTGPLLPPGAATSGLRGIVYFSGAGVGTACLTLAVWAVVGAGLALLGSGTESESELAAAGSQE